MVKLIPVLEITNFGENIPVPEQGPYWDYADEWEDYYARSNRTVGLKDPMKAYRSGSRFYELEEISDGNLVQLVKKALLEETEEDEHLLNVFYGGYVLTVNDQDILFPQCCADLSNIDSWQNLASDDPAYFYAGHPSPTITRKAETLLFDFTITIPAKESFAPRVPVGHLEVSVKELQSALETVNKQLAEFAERLKKINEREKLGVSYIAERIIWNRNP